MSTLKDADAFEHKENKVVDNAKRRRRSGEIPMLLKCVGCGFFSVVAWLLASSGDIGHGVRIGLYVVSAVSGLVAVGWLLGWVYSLAAAFAGIDGDASMLGGHSKDDAENAEQGGEAPLKVLAGMEVRFGDEEPETTSGAVSPSMEQGPPRDDSTVDVILGIIGDILSVFPHFLAVATITPMIVLSVIRIVASWIGLAPAMDSTLASLFIILIFFLSLGFSWRWRSQLAERDNSRLKNTIILLSSAEFAAFGVCAGLAVVGALVLALGVAIGLW